MLGLEIFDKRDAFNVLLGYVGFLVLVIMEIVEFIYANREKENRTGKILLSIFWNYIF